MMASTQMRVVSFNMHGKTDNVSQFKRCLNGEDIVCLQEVDDIAGTRDQYRDGYPYVFTTTNKTTVGSTKHTSIMVLSKMPFESYTSELIQTDPRQDKWERNAQHVVLKVAPGRTVDLFHYHNTYNYHDHDSEAERCGLTKFTQWVRTSLSIPDFEHASDVILAGDFNLKVGQGAGSLLKGLNYSNQWVDYVCGSMGMPRRGWYPTDPDISDHSAPWAALDVATDINAVAGPVVKIYNTEHHEYLYAADYKPHDSDRRRVFTWRKHGSAGDGYQVVQGIWRLEPVVEGVVRIFNRYQCEYLYAADFDPLDEDRRRVFTWRAGVPVRQGEWRVEDRGVDGTRFYNLAQDEYLYAASYKPFDDERRQVFTWRSGKPVTQGYWRLFD